MINAYEQVRWTLKDRIYQKQGNGPTPTAPEHEISLESIEEENSNFIIHHPSSSQKL